MFSAVFMITYVQEASQTSKDDLKDGLKEAADALSPVNIMGDVLEYAYGGGDLFLEIGFRNQNEYETAKKMPEWARINQLADDASVVDHYEFVAYGEGTMRLTGKESKCHRILIYEIVSDADPAAIEKMERIMPDMCDYIPGVINTKLAKVLESKGTMNWGYAFEVDFDEPVTFLTSYNYRPYHWSNVDKFFEPSCAEWVAHPNLCTPYIAADEAFLANYAE